MGLAFEYTKGQTPISEEEKVGLSKVLQNSGLIILTVITYISNATKFKLKTED